MLHCGWKIGLRVHPPPWPSCGDNRIPIFAGLRSLQPAGFTHWIRRITIHSSRRRFAARLNSGVRPVQKQMPVNKRETKLVFALSSPRPGVWFSPQTPCRQERRHSVSGFGLIAGAVLGRELKSGNRFSGKSPGWHRSNNSFKPRPLRGSA